MADKRFEFQNQDHHLNIVHDNKKGKVVFNEDIVDLLNNLYDENIHLKKVIERCDMSIDIKEKHLHKAVMNELQYKQKVKETLQEHYDFARNKKDNCKENDLICFHCYRVLKASINEIADELEVDLRWQERNDLL